MRDYLFLEVDLAFGGRIIVPVDNIDIIFDKGESFEERHQNAGGIGFHSKTVKNDMGVTLGLKGGRWVYTRHSMEEIKAKLEGLGRGK